MNILFAYKMAIQSIIDNKIRSLLTMLGVIIGVAAVIVAVGFAEGSMKTITNKVEGMGSNTVTAYITSRSATSGVTIEDLEKLDKNNDNIVSIAPYIIKTDIVKSGKNSKNTYITGTSSNYEEVQGTTVSSGRFINDNDIIKSLKVAVIGTAVENELFPTEDPIGKEISINGVKFTVIGVMGAVANGAEGTDDDIVLIPITVAQRVLKISQITTFMVSASSKETVDLVMSQVQNFLYKIYNDDSKYIVFSQEAILSVLGDISDVMSLVLGSIAAIALVVGGIGIMNIMLVSVSERTKEIGIRKAIGATNRDILVQFLIESLVIAGIGGIIGIIIAILIIKFGIGSTGLIEPVYSIPWIIAAFTICLTIGIIFGLIPANKAAKLNPIDALRNE